MQYKMKQHECELHQLKYNWSNITTLKTKIENKQTKKRSHEVYYSTNNVSYDAGQKKGACLLNVI